MASDFDDSDESHDSPIRTKVIKSAFDSESFDYDGTIHVEGLVGSATISPSGRDICLASPEGLSIIDLDSPYNAPRRIKSHGMPWLVVDVQWSPFAARDYWVASTANHCCLVWNLNRPDDSSAGAVEHSLRGHRRSITDINFSAHHPDMLATCSVDGYVHCWDLRRPNTPALTFIDWAAGATQVKYNRQDEHVLASSHNRCVHIWDDRKASLPLRTIEAHTSKIYGLDWNRTRSTCLVTCSLDKTIKFWDYSVRGGNGSDVGGGSGSGGMSIGSTSNLAVSGSIGAVGPVNENDVPERVIRTSFPIWRARHTPFGNGLLAMPQNAPGNLYLYDTRPTTALSADDPSAGNDPVAVFSGHGHHKVKEFLWRTRGGIEDGADNRDFQLVSWGEDNKLRLRRLDGGDLGTVGFQRGQAAPQNLNITRRGAVYKTFRILEDMGEYEKRSATMSSLRPISHHGAVSLPVSQGQSRLGSPTPEDGHQHHHHHHHHLHRHHQRYHEHQHLQLSSKPLSPSLPPPRSLSSSNIMRDLVKSPALTPQRNKFEQRSPWRNPSMRGTHVSSHKIPNQGSVQLDWMKGVNMNKRKTSIDPSMPAAQDTLAVTSQQDPNRKVSTDSALSSPMQMSTHDASVSMNSDVNEPESIQEEIVRITDKLPRIKWEDVDMDNLALTASMKGPWGKNGQLVFIKVRVLVPPNYPTSRAPRFYIDNSVLVPELTHGRITTDLMRLTAEFLKRRRNCLLVAFRYLLGEIDLPGSLALLDRALTNPRLANVGSDDDDDTSSDEDDDVDTSNEPYLSTITSANAENSLTDGPSVPLPPPPPPRSCGAYFTRDGRIVSFFLTKTGKASAKIMFEDPPPPTRSETAELQRPVFIGFGKVLPSRITASRRRKGGAAGGATGSEWYNDSSSSDESDSSTYSASSSSSTSSASSSSSSYQYAAYDMMDPWSSNIGFQRRIVRGKGGRRRRLSDFECDLSDSLVRSGTLDPDLPVGPKSTVVIEDMRHYLPSKRDLAREYAIFGDGADVCEHNARVAEKFGEADLANIWRYAALLLKSDVPLKLTSAFVDAGRRQKSVLVIARETVANASKGTQQKEQRKLQTSRSRDQLSGRVKWGLHPLARDFVNDLFDYFEQLADIQMLAMLSCIFGESFEEDSVAYAESHLSKPDTPLPMKAPSFSLDYVPTTRSHSNAVPPLLLLSGASTSAVGSASNNSSAATTPAVVFHDGSMDADDDYDDDFDTDYETAVWDLGNDNGLSRNNSFSGGETPPKWLGTNAGHGDGSGSGALSSSPLFRMAASRFFSRGNNAVVSAIAAGIPQTLTTLLSSSPNDRSAGAIPVPTPATASRRASFFGPSTPPSRESPQARTPLPHAVQPMSQTYKQLLLHSTSAYHDTPDPMLPSHRLMGGSGSTSPRNTALGKLSSLSSSPQDHAPIRKRPSPAETIFGNLTAGNLTWAASALFGGGGSGGSGGGNGSAEPSTEPGTAATSVSDEGRRREQIVLAAAANAAAKGARAQAEAATSTMVAVDVHVRTYNDHLFDDDGWMVASLLGGQRRRRLYAEYRYAYSELLQVWSEPLARLEVLKFNVLREDAMNAVSLQSRDDLASISQGRNGAVRNNSILPPVSLGANEKRERLLAVRDSGRGLDAVGICQYCEMQLEPLEYDFQVDVAVPAAAGSKLGGAVGVCRRCRRTRSQLRCVYCTEPVDAIYIPCFGCGCASHPQCLRAWYDAGERTCAAGDECSCPEEATSGRIESWTAMQAQLMMRSGGPTASNRDHDDLQTDPYQGHQPNLKARGLITQARRSAHKAPSSSSAMLAPTYGQHYHASSSGIGGGSDSGTAAFRANRMSVSSAPDYRDDDSDDFSNSHRIRPGATAGTGTATASDTGNNSSTSSTGGTVTSTGFWSGARRSKPAAWGLRQELQQQQYERQQEQSQSDPEKQSQKPGRKQTQSDGGNQGQSQQTPARSESASPGNHLSAARISLSSRLLRNSTLRRQVGSSTNNSGNDSDNHSVRGDGRGSGNIKDGNESQHQPPSERHQ